MSVNYEDIKLVSGSTWGFEIEGGYDENKNEMENDLRRLGIESDWDSSVEVFERYVEDAEIKVDGYWEEKECVKNIENLVNYLMDTTWTSNESCGIHVHVGNDYNLKNLIKLHRFIGKIEEIIWNGILPESRRCQSTYCKKIGSPTNPFNIFINSLSPKDIDEIKGNECIYRNMRRSMRGKTLKEYGLNIDSVFYKGTVEFRYFDSDYKRLIAFIDFVDKIVNKIETEDTRTLDNLADEVNHMIGIERKVNRLCKWLGVADVCIEKLMCHIEKPMKLKSVA